MENQSYKVKRLDLFLAVLSTLLNIYIYICFKHVLDQVDRRDYGEGFRHKSPQREGGRREPRREKSQSEPERGGGGNKGRNAVFAAQKLVRRGGGWEIF